MKRRQRTTISNHLFAIIVMCGLCGGALAFAAGFHVDVRSQVAVGAASNAACMGGADAKCPCGQGLKAGKCDASVRGGGKIGCPCKDTTSGDEAASGKCAAVGKCQAEKADGMMPMLPMLPMPMPMMPMPMPPSCPPTAAATTSAASTTHAVAPELGTDPNCLSGTYGAQEAGGFWSSVWDATNPFSSSGSSTSSLGSSSARSSTAWTNVLNSLGITSSNSATNQTSATQKPVSYTATSSGGISAKGNASSGVNTQNTTEFSGKGSTFSYVDPTSPASLTVLSQMQQTLQKMLDIVRRMF